MINERLQRKIDESGLPISIISQLSGVSRSTIYDALLNKRPTRRYTLARLSKVLRCKVEDIQ